MREVLAVNTAGMLVRRSVLESLGGLDEDLPIFGNDIDFGWRAALAGHRTLVVPQAVVFHAEAAHRGIRRTPLTGRHTHYQERRAALLTSLANVSSRGFAWQYVRLFLGSLLRVVGFLVVRSVGEALDELAAALSVHGRPRQVLAARRERADLRQGDPADVRRLLAPAWLPYRHGLDFVTDLASAATSQAADVAERRRLAKAADAPGTGPGVREARRGSGTSEDDDEDAYLTDSGIVARFFTNPVAVVLALFGVLSLLAAREAFGSITGGALSPVPAAAATGGACTSRAGTRSAPAPTCRPLPTCCRSRSPRPSCSATPEPSCPASCCSPSRWRRGARGGCSRSSDGSSTRWGCRAGWWCGVR